MKQIEIIQLDEPEALNYLLGFYPLGEDVSQQTSTYNGKQTSNMVSKVEPSLLSHLLHRYFIPAHRKIKPSRYSVTELEIDWLHFIEYFGGGEQMGHTHVNNEDYSFILYLNDCSDGATIFYGPDPSISPLEVLPKKGKLVIFPSYIYHKAKVTNSNKKILVGSLLEIGKKWEKRPI
jgi:hypothetical protein